MTFAIPENIVAVLTDPATYGDQRIFEAYRWLRANQPLGIASRRGFNPFWVVTRHADIQTISQQNQLFRSSDRPVALLSSKAEAKIEAATGGNGLLRTLVQMDAPDHPKFRALTQKWFTPGNLRSIEGKIRNILVDARPGELKRRVVLHHAAHDIGLRRRWCRAHSAQCRPDGS